MKNLNLIVHCGGYRADLDQVTNTETPAPEGIWHPIPHRDLYDQVNKALGALDMRIVAEQHALAKDGKRYFGLLQVANGHAAGDDFSYVVGLRNSHDKCFPAGLVVGAGVFVCDNLSFNGEIKLARKHTTHIARDLPILTGRAVGQLAERWTAMSERFTTYKQHELSDSTVHDLVIRALDVGVCNQTDIKPILTEWRTPRHPEFAQAGKTAWRLFNAFTEVAKDNSVFTLPKRTTSLHGLLDSACGLITVNPVNN